MRKPSIRLCALSGVSALMVTPVHAQTVPSQVIPTEDVALQDIIVTAQKRDQSVTDVPLAISVFGGEQLRELSAQRLTDIAVLTPGFVIEEQNSISPSFSIRGITSDGSEPTLEQRVSVFQDGISLSSPRAASVELFDIERVEILKGPQGTLFGRSALIGAVSIIQNKASSKDVAGYVEVRAAEYDQVRGEAMINLPVIADHLAVRISGVAKTRDGYRENTLGPDPDSNRTQAIRGVVSWTPSADIRFDLIGNYEHNSTGPLGTKNGIIPADGGDTDPFSSVSLSSFGDIGSLGGRRTVKGVTLLGNADLTSRLSLSSITGLRSYDSSLRFDPDGSAFEILAFDEQTDGRQFSQELRLNYADDRVSAFVGAAYFDDRNAQTLRLGFDERAFGAVLGSLGATGVDPATGATIYGGDEDLANLFLTGNAGLLAPVLAFVEPFSLLKPFHVETIADRIDTEAFDLFGEAAVRITPELELTGGIRWTTTKKEDTYTAGFETDPSILSQFFLGSPTIIAPITNGPRRFSARFDNLAYRAVLRYEPAQGVSVFASYARGVRPRNIVPDGDGSDFLGFRLPPAETVDSYEGGFKAALLGRRLYLDASVFHYRYRDFQTTVIDAQSGLAEVVNAGRATSTGAEAQVNGRIAKGLTVFGSYGYNRARFADDPGLQFSGKRFRLSPDHRFSVGADLRLPVADGAEAFVRPTYTWQSKVYFNEDNIDAVDVFLPDGTPFYTLPAQAQEAYGLLALRVGVRVNGLEVEAFAENLLDQRYLIDAGNTGASFGIPTFAPGAPRVIGGRVSFRF